MDQPHVCDICGAEFTLDRIPGTATSDLNERARLAAQSLKQNGWSAPRWDRFRCGECVTKTTRKRLGQRDC